MTLDETTMEPLYERLLQQAFVSDKEAIEYCGKVCLDYGFNIKHEIGANRSIYIYCLHEKNTRKRPSSSNNTKECQWRIVLSQEDEYQWKFRKSLNPESSEHNHEIITTEGDTLPQDIMDKAIQLISDTTRQKQITDEDIITSIKLEFPNLLWSESRFLNFVSQERKRKRQKDVTQTVQKLIMASTKLCSVVAANEDWTSCVENDLNKMLDTYRQRTRVSNQSLDTMVDLQLDMIHSEIDKARKSTNYGLKKRKSNMLIENVQIMSIPSCTLYIRSQPLRSLSEPSSNTTSRRAFNDLISSSSSSSTTAVAHHLNNANFNVNSVFALTSPISSPSSTSSIQQRIDYTNRNNEMLQSPPIPDAGNNNNMIMSTNYHHGSTTSAGGGNSTGNNYNVYPFSSYQQQQSGTYGGNNNGNQSNNGGDVNFSFEPTTTYGQLTTTPSPAPILIHRNTGYYGGGRESSPTGIQQRMMMQQQEYEARHLIENNSNVHLPTIRSTGGVHHHHLMNTMVQHHHQQQQQQQQQHHHHGNMNPNQPQQNWS